MKKDKKNKKKKKYMGGGMMPMAYMGGGMTPMAYEDGGPFKMQPGESVDGMDVDTKVKKPNMMVKGAGAATQGNKFFG